MHAFDVLGDPVRRRILELLASGEQSAGTVVTAIAAEFKISQPAVSQHLKVLREAGFASVRAEGTRRLYAVDPAPLREVDAWLDPFRAFWEQRLDALATELARGRRARRTRRAEGETMIDIARQIAAIGRHVEVLAAGGETVSVTLSRRYDAELADVWDALTDPDRISRWMLPISGDLRVKAARSRWRATRPGRSSPATNPIIW